MFLDHHIRVICEGSCDTEDWTNDDAEHSALITGINVGYSHKKTAILNYNNISKSYSIFDQINAALVSRRAFKMFKNSELFRTFDQCCSELKCVNASVLFFS